LELLDLAIPVSVLGHFSQPSNLMLQKMLPTNAPQSEALLWRTIKMVDCQTPGRKEVRLDHFVALFRIGRKYSCCVKDTGNPLKQPALEKIPV
jgi:hypothetical protein